MPFGFLAGALGGILGGVGSAVAGSEAAGAQRYAADLQKQMYEETVAREAPFVQGGQNALIGLEQGLGIGPYSTGTGYGPLDKPFDWSNLQNTPGYQWQLGQGEQALLDTATARGGVGGAGTAEALLGYGQGLASTYGQQQFADYITQQQNALQALGALTTLGSNAASNSATGGSTYAANIGANLAGAGASTAAGTMGLFNSLGGGLNALANQYMLGTQASGFGGVGGLTSYGNTGGGGGGGYSLSDVTMG